MSHESLEPLLGHAGSDPGCDIGFTQLDRYCDAVLRGEDADRQFPDLVTHIRNCAACREDTEGLLAVLRQLERNAH